MKIPLHSLVLDFTNPLSPINQKFINPPDDRSYISYDKIRHELFGNDMGYYVSNDILQEFKRRIKLKLWIGEQVIVNAHDLKKYERDQITAIATEMGIEIFYLFDSYATINDKDLERGDGVAQTVAGTVTFLHRLSGIDLSSYVALNYNGLSIIGDIHGHYENMRSVLLWTNMRNNLPVFLGDLLDFGPKSLECIEELYKLVIRNQAVFIIGNHERKIYKWLNKLNNKNIKIHLSEANKQTIEQIKKLSFNEKRKWEVKFRTLMNLGFTHLFTENIFLAHASYKDEMKYYQIDRVLPFELEKKALFGEFIDNPNWEDMSNASYSWITEIPKDLTVFVGHEPRNFFKPYYEKNKQGGEVYFMDTGCGKGGFLSSADLKLENNKYVLVNFNNW